MNTGQLLSVVCKYFFYFDTQQNDAFVMSQSVQLNFGGGRGSPALNRECLGKKGGEREKRHWPSDEKFTCKLRSEISTHKQNAQGG